ncbi:MAG: ABC transporter ATP-binding protein, partial [Nitrospinota bacterium]
MALLETRDLTKNFGGLVAVNGVDYRADEGALRAIIGPNGAGKTTFFNMVAGALPATRGQIFFRGEDITHLSPHERSHKGISRTYQLTNVFSDLSALENIRIAAQSRKTSYNFWSRVESHRELTEKAEQILEDVQLADKRDFPASALAHGE